MQSGYDKSLAELVRLSYPVKAPAYLQEKTYFDIITLTLEAMMQRRTPAHSRSQIEKAMGDKFDLTSYTGFENKGFIIDDKG
ncbi:MAG: hypothetical protein LBN33_05910 [Desulfovibrio sp.]|jgi:hypothetical protein|nr:hypothetical protein [Desulfovibrio sp.]